MLGTPLRNLYLDFNSTTPLAPSVGEAMQPFWEEHFLLPSQEHRGGRALCEMLDYAREGVAALLDCESYEIIFTSGGTEANNLAIIGACRSWRDRFKQPGRIIVCATEHDSVIAAAESLGFEGWHVDKIAVDSEGLIDPGYLETMLTSDTVLVCLQAACAMTGVMQPVREIADICHSRGVLVHCDAAQAAGKYPLNIASLHADTVSLSGHKMYGPKGIGALYVRRGLELSPILYGENQEMGLRPGAGNIPGAVGMGAAARMVNHGVEDALGAMENLRDRFEQRVTRALSYSPFIIGMESKRLPNTSLMHIPTKRPLRLSKDLPEVVVSRARSFAPEDWMARSLREIGLSQHETERCLRVSVGWTTSHDLIDEAAEQIIEAVHLS